jgi:hypothetical protein
VVCRRDLATAIRSPGAWLARSAISAALSSSATSARNSSGRLVRGTIVPVGTPAPTQAVPRRGNYRVSVGQRWN